MTQDELSRMCYPKKRFESEKAALDWGRSAWTGFALRVYECPNQTSERHYHLTKLPGDGPTVTPDLSCRAERRVR